MKEYILYNTDKINLQFRSQDSGNPLKRWFMIVREMGWGFWNAGYIGFVKSQYPYT